jgi:hypothetical protein
MTERPSVGIRTISKAPERMIEHNDNAIAIGINRKERGFYTAVLILPSGKVAAVSASTQKESLIAIAKELELTDAQIKKYFGNVLAR